MFCTGCGNKLNETDKFCKVCGTKNLYYNEEAIPANHKVEAAGSSEKPQEVPIIQNQEDTVPQNEIRMPEEAVAAGDGIPGMQGEKADGRQADKDAIIQPEMVIMPVEQIGNLSKAPEVPIDIRKESKEGKVTSKASAETQAKKRKSGTGLMAGSVLLSVFAFIMIIIFLTTLFAKTILSQKTMEAAIQEVDYTEIEVGNVLENSGLDISVEEGDTTIDVVYEALSEQGKVDISRSDLEQIFEESTFTGYLSEKLAQYARFAVTGEEPDEVTALEILDLVDENKKIIEEASGLEITDDDLDELESYLEEDGFLDAFSIEEVENTIEENNLNKVQNIFSDTMLLIVLIASAVLFIGDIVLIGYLHKKARAELNFIGIPVLVGGVLFTAAILTLYILKTKLFGELDYLLEAIKPVLRTFFTKGILIGGVTIIIGTIMVVCYGLIKGSSSRNQVKEV